ncbi:hypothetical protein AB0K08_00405 [Citricoccus sp. NPDC055426]
MTIQHDFANGGTAASGVHLAYPGIAAINPSIPASALNARS